MKKYCLHFDPIVLPKKKEVPFLSHLDAGLHKLWQPGCEKIEREREYQEEMKRDFLIFSLFRERKRISKGNEKRFPLFSLFPPSLSISFIKKNLSHFVAKCEILGIILGRFHCEKASQDVRACLDEIQKVYSFVVTLKINQIYQWRSMCSMFEWLIVYFFLKHS